MMPIKRVSSPPQHPRINPLDLKQSTIEQGGGRKRLRRKRTIALMSLASALFFVLQGRVMMVLWMTTTSDGTNSSESSLLSQEFQSSEQQEHKRKFTGDPSKSRRSVVVKNATQTKQHKDSLTVKSQSVPRLPHPHAGARDEFGQWGYVHDPTYVKLHPLPFTKDLSDGNPAICDARFGLGEEGFDGYLGLQKINISNTPTTATKSLPRILCIVYTHSNRHETLVRTIVETYAPHCDGFMAASNQTNRTIGAVDLPHKGPESYAEMWNKVRSIWGYVHDHYLNDFDYFHLNGDDTYVIAENLRHYVSTLHSSSTSPSPDFQYLGAIMADFKPRRTYCGGGGGYTLNRATLKLLVETIFPTCGSNFTSPQEDFIVGICFLRHNRTLLCGDTRDEQGATRYHQATAEWQVQWRGGKANVMRNDILMERYHFQYKSRLEGISASSISFHLKDPSIRKIQRTMRRYHAILYPETCSKG